jgi:hypothetical protein
MRGSADGDADEIARSLRAEGAIWTAAAMPPLCGALSAMRMAGSSSTFLERQRPHGVRTPDRAFGARFRPASPSLRSFARYTSGTKSRRFTKKAAGLQRKPTDFPGNRPTSVNIRRTSREIGELP